MDGHVETCVEGYCELAGINTLCMGDLLEIYKVHDQLQAQYCACLDHNHLFQFLGCARNTQQDTGRRFENRRHTSIAVVGRWDCVL